MTYDAKKEKLNVLILAPQPFFQDRGTPIAVRDVVETLSKGGHHIDVLTFHEGEPVSIPNCRIKRIPAIPGIRNVPPGFSWKKIICDLEMVFCAIGMIMRRRYDVVHAVEEAVFIAIVLRVIGRIPFIYDMDSSMPIQLTDKYNLPRPVVRLLEKFEGFGVRMSIGVVAVCKSLEDIARKTAPKKPILRLEDMSRLADGCEGSEDIRTQLSLKGSIMMYVGNLEEYQGIDLLLESHRQLMDRRNDVTLVIIGGRDEDIQRYQQRAADRGISESVFFLGVRPTQQLGYYLRQADILVSPRTKGNNTPMKIYSYLDSGVPVIATNLLTHSQVLNNEISMLCEPTPEGISAGAAKLLDDSELRASLARNARQCVQDQFGPKAFAEKLLGFYDGLHLPCRAS